MHLATDTESLKLVHRMPVRTESAAARLLRKGELGAHLLQLARGAAAEHLAQKAQEATVSGREQGREKSREQPS